MKISCVKKLSVCSLVSRCELIEASNLTGLLRPNGWLCFNGQNTMIWILQKSEAGFWMDVSNLCAPKTFSLIYHYLRQLLVQKKIEDRNSYKLVQIKEGSRSLNRKAKVLWRFGTCKITRICIETTGAWLDGFLTNVWENVAKYLDRG